MPRHHQDLLEELRRLRQGVELTRVHAARHQVVARPFGRRLRQDRRLDLPEPLRRQFVADGQRHPVAEAHVLLHPAPAQIEVAVPQAHLLGHGRLVRNGERRRLRLVEHADLAAPAPRPPRCRSSGLTVSAERRCTWPGTAITYSGSQPLGRRPSGPRLVRPAHDDLADALTVADVDEEHPAQVAHAVHPAEEDDIAARRRPGAGRRRYGSGSGRLEGLPRHPLPLAGAPRSLKTARPGDHPTVQGSPVSPNCRSRVQGARVTAASTGSREAASGQPTSRP